MAERKAGGEARKRTTRSSPPCCSYRKCGPTSHATPIKQLATLGIIGSLENTRGTINEVALESYFAQVKVLQLFGDVHAIYGRWSFMTLSKVFQAHGKRTMRDCLFHVVATKHQHTRGGSSKGQTAGERCDIAAALHLKLRSAMQPAARPSIFSRETF